MSLARRAAFGILRGVVRLAPAGSRRWGTAMLSELDHVDGDLAALRWALGGTTAICRHALSQAHPLRRLVRGRLSARSALALGGAVLALALLLLASRGGMSVSASRPAGADAPARSRAP
jgi:hypothetical protein